MTFQNNKLHVLRLFSAQNGDSCDKECRYERRNTCGIWLVTFLTYEAASSSVYTSALKAPLRRRPFTTGFMGGDTSSSRESERELLAFCWFWICLASSCSEGSGRRQEVRGTEEKRWGTDKYKFSWNDSSGTRLAPYSLFLQPWQCDDQNKLLSNVSFPKSGPLTGKLHATANTQNFSTTYSYISKNLMEFHFVLNATWS